MRSIMVLNLAAYVLTLFTLASPPAVISSTSVEVIGVVKEVEVKFVVEQEFPSFIATVTGYAPLDPNAVEGMCYSGDPNTTASGAKVQANRTVAAGRSIPFGTLLMIEGFDGIIFEVQDRGGMIKDDCIDVFMLTRKEALRFGRQKRQVWILQWGR
jgi:3D (Asp-Asp-Asp) domain-containing protein